MTLEHVCFVRATFLVRFEPNVANCRPRRPGWLGARMDTSVSNFDGKSYDLFINPGERRLVWSYSDHGVKLTDDAIAWSVDGQESQASFRDILEVHLQLGYIKGKAVATCRLRFADETSIVVVSGDSFGFPDAELDRLYVEFIHDLHARLAALPDARTAFTSGFSEARRQFGEVAVVIAGLFFVVMPAAALLLSWEWKTVILTYSGVLLVWPVYKMIQINAPRTYDPRHVPQELMPGDAQAGADDS
jgi:hypothetical protein